MKVTKEFYQEFEIDLNTSCNLKCPLCTRNYEHSSHLYNGPRTGRPLHEITAQLDTFPNLKKGSIAGMFSEPTMYKDFLSFVKYLNSRDIEIDLHTSGDLRNDAFWIELAQLLKKKDNITFTVCGSTQEIHEKYRIGSNLNRMLEVAKLVEDNCISDNNVQMQVINFEYNDDDIDNIFAMLSNYNNVHLVFSEGFRTMNLTDFINPPSDGISPPVQKLKALKGLYNARVNQDGSIRKDGKINCAFYNKRKITINNDGSEWACHIQSEFEIPFNYDYSKIFAFEHDSCLICEKQTQTILSTLGLDDVN